MDITTLAVLLLLAALAAYVQTLTGFAFGVLMIGGVALSNIVPLYEVAILVSILVLVNAVHMLIKGWRQIAWPQFIPVMLVSLLFVGVGYWLLGLLLAVSLSWIKLILGVIIMLSSIPLLLQPAAGEKISGTLSFCAFAAIAGLMGGLFSTSGPPLVYHFYRQPLPLPVIRETLVAIFALNALSRLLFVSLDNAWPGASFWWSLLAIPVVIAFTSLARHYPPPLSNKTIKRLVFSLLFLSGLSLGAPALFSFW